MQQDRCLVNGIDQIPGVTPLPQLSLAGCRAQAEARKLEAAAASRSGAPMDQAVELADTTPETGAAARAVALRRIAVAVLGAEQAVALLGA